jgi:hypothetical protein
VEDAQDEKTPHVEVALAVNGPTKLKPRRYENCLMTRPVDNLGQATDWRILWRRPDKQSTRLEKRRIRAIIPPRRNARIWQHGNSGKRPLSRDAAVREIRRRGRRQWKERIGYHRRSLSETAMYRMKCCFGDHLKNREIENQRTETRIRSKILNKFTRLGLPQFEWN